MAARRPPGPEPITTKSYGRIRGILNFFGGLRGLRGKGSFRNSIIGDLGGHLTGFARAICVRVCKAHQMVLHGETFAIVTPPDVGVLTVGSERPRFQIVLQVRGQNLLADALPQSFVFQRVEHLYSFVEISWHPVGTAQINFGSAAVLEIKNAAVLQKAAHNAAHSNAAADAAQA